MYYIWRNDTCGRALLAEVINAAGRGVAVRLLIDDINPADSDDTYLSLNSRPNIELRLFNPSSVRDRGPARWAEWAWRVKALNRRMHGKAWIVDSEVAIMGGRNVGDEYYGQARANFRDLDVLLLGDAVCQAQAIFNEFWAHPLAQPINMTARSRSGSRSHTHKQDSVGADVLIH